MQDWNDKDCLRILSNVRSAMGTAACSLLIVEVSSGMLAGLQLLVPAVLISRPAASSSSPACAAGT